MTTIERQKLEDAIRVFYIDKKELEFREVIGKGGFGLVTKGYYRGKKCAIKSIYIPANTRYSGGLTSDDPYLDFLNEMNVQLKLDHQNILTVYGWSSDEACLYVVMELMPYPLNKLLKYTRPEYKFTPKYEPYNSKDSSDQQHKKKRKKKLLIADPTAERTPDRRKKKKRREKIILSNQMKLQIAHEIAEGMYYLHTREKPIVHRDLKSMNVLLTSDLSCSICDFGFASMRNQNSGISGMKGTSGWMAPEMFKHGSIKKGTKCDIYSFGMILYELLTHQIPFYEIDNPFQVTNQVLQGVLPSLEQDLEKDNNELLEHYDGNDKDIVKTLIRLFKQCTAQNPNDRPDFIDIIYDLQNVPVNTKIQYVVDPEAQFNSLYGVSVFDKIQDAINAVPNNVEQRRIVEEQCGIVADNINRRDSGAYEDIIKVDSPLSSSPNSSMLKTPRSFIKSTKELYTRNFVDLEELKEKARFLLFSNKKDSPRTPDVTSAMLQPSPRTNEYLDVMDRTRRRLTVEFSSSPLGIENNKKQNEKMEQIRDQKQKESKLLVQKGRLIDKHTGIPYTIDEKGQWIVLSNNTLKPPLIKVRPGQYKEFVYIDRDIQLIGTDSSGTNGVIVEQISHEHMKVLEVRACTNVTLQNFTFVAAATSTSLQKSPVVRVAGSSQSVTISNCKFKSVQLEIDDNSESVVSKCSVTDCNTNTGGLYIHNFSSGHFFDNSFQNNANANIVISHNADPIIEFNDIWHSKNLGILCSHDGKGWITRNEIYENDGHGIQIHTNAKPLIEHNAIDHNGGRGIDCGVYAAGIIRHNDIQENDQTPQIKVADLNPKVIVEDNNNIKDDSVTTSVSQSKSSMTSDMLKRTESSEYEDDDSDEYTYTDDSDDFEVKGQIDDDYESD